MILTRSPLRISIGGGGTDLPSYYKQNEGFVFSAAIDKYVYVAVNKPFTQGYFLKYAKYEKTQSIDEIDHPIIRESLRLFPLKDNGIEISTLADIPSGTGLGSSGSFTTALLKALAIFSSKPMHAAELAAAACRVEIDLLKEPIGKQDQYIAAFGGFTTFTFHKNGQVTAEPVPVGIEVIHELEDNLLLFYTGTTRSASAILKDQDIKTNLNEKSMVENLDFIKNLGFQSRDLLIKGDLTGFALLMNEHWEFKRKRSNGMTNDFIDNAYNLALKNGAVGGKLVGAGGGGFLMFYTTDPERLRMCMSNLEMDEIRFKFDFQGTSVVVS